MRRRMPVRELKAKVSWESMLLPEAWPLMVRLPPISAPGEASIGSGEAPTTMSSAGAQASDDFGVRLAARDRREDDFGAAHCLEGLAGIARFGIDVGVGA
jgi:hypothetical protein